MAETEQQKKDKALANYRRVLLQHKEVDTKVRAMRESMKEIKKRVS